MNQIGKEEIAERFHPFELVVGGMFGALALVFPQLFHLLGPMAGSIFLPMFLPISALACLVNWRVSLSVSIVVPLLSSTLTGMPPLPIALIMVSELVFFSLCLYWFYQRRGLNIYLSIILSALANRLLLILYILVLGEFLLRHQIVLSLIVALRGIPGFALQIFIVPPLVRALEPRLREMQHIG